MKISDSRSYIIREVMQCIEVSRFDLWYMRNDPNSNIREVSTMRSSKKIELLCIHVRAPPVEVYLISLIMHLYY